MSEPAAQHEDGLGTWIGFWDVLVAFAALAATFLLVRLDAVPQLNSLAADNGYFKSHQLLLDTYRHGYGYDVVRDHLRALGDEGRAYYANTFIPFYDMALSLFLLTF